LHQLSLRAVAVVVDPIQSVKGKVMIDAFRLINPNMMVLGQVCKYNVHGPI
jgi:26S proteasome regulatory subunit N11